MNWPNVEVEGLFSQWEGAVLEFHHLWIRVCLLPHPKSNFPNFHSYLNLIFSDNSLHSWHVNLFLLLTHWCSYLLFTYKDVLMLMLQNRRMGSPGSRSWSMAPCRVQQCLIYFIPLIRETEKRMEDQASISADIWHVSFPDKNYT